jgi:L-iditol 2-dehydrogenase
MLAWSLEAPGRFEQREITAPKPSDLAAGEVLLRVLVGGICGSDLPYFAGKMHALMPDDAPNAARIPGFPMHEVVAEVVASHDPQLKVGEHVVGWVTRSNGLSGYVVNSGRDVLAYDRSFDPVQAITLQPLACVLDAMNDLGDVNGAAVAVLGQGPIGLLFSHVAKSRGARVVVGVDRVDRSDCIADFKLDRFVHSSSDRWAANVGDDEAPDVVIETIGHQVGTLAHAITAAAVNARIYCFGIPDDDVYPLPMKSVLRKRLTLRAGWVLPQTRRAALAEANAYLLDAPELAKAFVTDIYPFDDVPRAFADAAAPRTGRAKITIQVAADGRDHA